MRCVGRCGLTPDVRCATPDTCVGQCLAEYITTRTHLTVFHTNSLPGSKLADLHTGRVPPACAPFAFCLLVHAPADSSMRRRTPPDLARLAAARGALRRRQLRAYQPPAQRRAPAVSGSQASPSGRARVPVGALGAPRTAAAGGSPRQPRGTLEGAQRAVHRRRLRPTTPRRCGSSGAALVARRRSPARWSSHTRSTTTCKGPRARGVVQTPEPHSGRAMGAALTRPTSIMSGSTRSRACGV